ncbi:MAG TPA: MEDS domain-containing protein [Nitrososphaera sp.]|nr:MEDS domain-containing protein [Nitrososphaera sp.]
MNSEKTDYRPIKFLDRMEVNKHTVLLYDNQEYADMIIARYLLNGLEKGESCIFFTPDDSAEVEERLAAHGIDVDSYKQKKSLRIFHTERSDSSKTDALETLKRIRDESTKGMEPPYRFVGRTITDTASVEGMKLGLVVERTGHENFEQFDCSQLCYYDISGIEQSRRGEWIKGLLKNHHHVIYASEPDKAVAFETTLLEEE